MTATEHNEPLNTLWRNQFQWSQAANAMKHTLYRARLAALALLISGTVFATVTATWLRPPATFPQVLAGLAAIALASAAIITAQYLGPDRTREWAKARAVAEGIKSAVYRFRTGAEPYTGFDAAERLRDDVAMLEDSASDLHGRIGAVNTGWGMADLSWLTPHDYTRKRVLDQISYYRPKARDYAYLARCLRVGELVCGIAAAAVTAFNCFLPEAAEQMSLAPWAAALTTLAGLAAAHAAARRYEFLVDSYNAAANRLERRLHRWQDKGEPIDPASWSAFVNDCENIIAAENQSWVAKWADRSG